MIKDHILTWLSRETPSKASNTVGAISAVFATETGLVRQENQDRAVGMSCTLPDGKSHAVYVLADGMGGMRDGAYCASLAIASFLERYATLRVSDIPRRLTEATRYANEQVFERYNGSGGATLSAVVIDGSPVAFVANVGDSRVYRFKRGEAVQRLTVDDSLAEAVGGHGRELIQFVGMGEGIQPHIEFFNPRDGSVLITSDGVHYIQQDIFNTILTLSPTGRAAADRLMALARWCGGPDNATLIMVEPALAMQALSPRPSGFQLWDSNSNLHIVLSGQDLPVSRGSAATTLPLNMSSEINDDSEDVRSKDLVKKPKTRSKRARKSRKAPQDKIQLEIDVDLSPTEGSVDVDR